MYPPPQKVRENLGESFLYNSAIFVSKVDKGENGKKMRAKREEEGKIE